MAKVKSRKIYFVTASLVCLSFFAYIIFVLYVLDMHNSGENSAAAKTENEFNMELSR
jgi:hypothetical protein